MHATELWKNYKHVTEIEKIYKKFFRVASMNEESEEHFTTLNWDYDSHAGKIRVGSHKHRGCVWFCHEISYGNLLQEARLGNSYSRYLLQKLISGISLQAYVEQTAFHRLIEVKWGWLPEERFMTVLCAYRTASYRINQITLKKLEHLSARADVWTKKVIGPYCHLLLTCVPGFCCIEKKKWDQELPRGRL